MRDCIVSPAGDCKAICQEGDQQFTHLENRSIATARYDQPLCAARQHMFTCARGGLDIGSIGHPNPVRCINLKLTIQPIFSDDRRIDSISVRAAFVADLCCDTCQVGQTCKAFPRTVFTLIKKIIVQLAIAVNFAAGRPCLLDNLGLT